MYRERETFLDQSWPQLTKNLLASEDFSSKINVFFIFKSSKQNLLLLFVCFDSPQISKHCFPKCFLRVMMPFS